MDNDNPPVEFQSSLNALAIVAHPDDETLWAGGLMLMSTNWNWTVLSLCRGDDRERRRRFFQVMGRVGARGLIGDLDDSPEQPPLADETVESALLFDLPERPFDLVVTHSPFGEYTRHLRHEEVARGVLSIWEYRRLKTKELWLFAYDDADKNRLPRAIEDAHVSFTLTNGIWREKHMLMTELYGFAPDSWEGKTTPRKEAFWRFRTPAEAMRWRESAEGKGRRSPPIIATAGRPEDNQVQLLP